MAAEPENPQTPPSSTPETGESVPGPKPCISRATGIDYSIAGKLMEESHQEWLKKPRPPSLPLRPAK